MMAIFKQGEPIQVDYTPGGAVNSGDVVVVNGVVAGVSHLDITASQLGSLAINNGVYILTGDAAIPAGAQVFWDASAVKGTQTTINTTTGLPNPLFGIAQTACGGSGQTFDVLLEPGLPIVTGSSIVIGSTASGLTAHASGGQTSAIQIQAQINQVSTVGSAGDSAKLPPSVPGTPPIFITNAAGVNSMNVFPATGDAINALSANAAFAVAAGKSAIFVCPVAGQWYAILTA